jgi:PAS domain S-box-containing protein
MTSHVLSFVLIWGSVALVAGMTWLAWRQRPRPGAVYFAALLLAGTWWVGTYAATLYSPAGPAALLADLQWFGVVAAPVAWLLFTMEYSGRDAYITTRSVAAASVVPVVTLGFVLSGSGLVVAAESVVAYDTITIVTVTYGPWAYVFVGYAWLLLGAGMVLVFQLALETSTTFRAQAAAMLVAGLAPGVGSVVSVAGVGPVPELDLTPFMFVISGGAGLAALSQLGFLQTTPVSSRQARDAVVESLDDGIVVLDAEHRIVDINEAAAAVLGVSTAAVMERPASEHVPGFDQLETGTPGDTTMISLTTDGERAYELTVTDLADSRSRRTGAILTLHDVTDRRNHIQQLSVLNRVLRHNLRNEMNVLYGVADRIDDPELAARIKGKAMEMVELGDKAREIDEVLGEGEDREPVEVGAVTDFTIESLAAQYDGVAFSATLPEASCWTDPVLGPVLENVVENAAEHNDAAEPHVAVTVTPGDGVVTITVSDNGPGIPKGEREVIGTDRETQLEHGSGLGLWLVDWGVRSAGGGVSLSATETGTEVTIELPRREPAAST